MEKNIGHSYLKASQDDFFTMNPSPTESSQLAGCPLLQLPKLLVNTIVHLPVPLKNVKPCAQHRGGLPSVVVDHAYEVCSPMITALLSCTNVCPLPFG